MVAGSLFFSFFSTVDNSLVSYCTGLVCCRNSGCALLA